MSKSQGVPQPTYSLARYRALSQSEDSRGIWLGGRVLQCSKVEVQLFGQGLVESFKWQVRPQELVRGAYVAVKVSEGKILEIQVLSDPQNFFRETKLQPHVCKDFGDFLNAVRQILKELQMLEVNTPTLVTCPGMEAELQPFKTQFEMGQRRDTLYLATSPELHLKKMLASGYTDIYELKTCFRNGEISDHHQPEFLMLEWYRAFADLELISTDLQKLLNGLAKRGFIEGAAPQIQFSSMAELFKEYLNFTLEPHTEHESLVHLCRQRDLPIEGHENWNELFHLLFLSFIEPHLGDKGPLIIKGFPPSQAALAQIDNEGWADRFEFYWRGLEIANAFHELTDATIQEQRFHIENERRVQQGGEPLPIDQEFLSALRSGLPPSGGVALGVERLYLACQNKNELGHLRGYPMI